MSLGKSIGGPSSSGTISIPSTTPGIAGSGVAGTGWKPVSGSLGARGVESVQGARSSLVTGVGVPSGASDRRVTMQTLPSSRRMGEGTGAGGGTASPEKRRYITPMKAATIAPAMAAARIDFVSREWRACFDCRTTAHYLRYGVGTRLRRCAVPR